MGGPNRRPTLQPKHAEEEEAPKEKIKFDIFNEEEGTDYMKKTVLDNVTIIIFNIDYIG